MNFAIGLPGNRATIGFLLLATCLLFGCAGQGDGSLASDVAASIDRMSSAAESAESASSAAEQPTEEPPKQEDPPAENKSWRACYAEVAVDSLYADPRMKADEISLFHHDDALPLLVMSYLYTGNDDDWRRFYRAWTYENNDALLVYEGNSYIKGVSADTGEPVVYSDSDDSEAFIRQSETLPLICGHEGLESAYGDFDPTEKIRDFLGVSGWRPSVPKDAPQWVSDYLSLLHNHLFFSYYPDKSVHIRAEGLYAVNGQNQWTGLALLEPPEPGEAPILVGHFVSPSHMLGYTPYVQAIPLKNRMLFLEDNPDGGHAFFKDAQGRHLIMSQTYTSSVWSTIGEYDLDTLFRSGSSYLQDPLYAYLDDEYVEFGPETEESMELARAWVEDRVQDQLAELGYTELLGWPYAEIHLPEVASWNEIESILIEEFCAYARSIGQM